MTSPYPQTKGLGWRTAVGVSDATANVPNPYLPGTGWDVIFTPDVLNIQETEFEVYHIAVDGPIGSSLAILVDGHQWDYVAQGWANGWDPSQPLLVKFGQTVQFCWNFAFTNPPYNKSSNVQATATLWLRREDRPGLMY